MRQCFAGENRRLTVLTVSFLAAVGLNILDELFQCMRDLTSCVYIGVILGEWLVSQCEVPPFGAERIETMSHHCCA